MIFAGCTTCLLYTSHKLLFDVGASPIFARNAKKLGVELTDVEYVAISHGHYDHTDGMEAFCDINQKASIYLSLIHI